MCHTFCDHMLRWPLIALLAMGGIAPARAMTIIQNNTTIDYAINDDVRVTRWAVVNLVAGGSIAGSLIVEDTSTVNVDGGSMGGSLDAMDNSTANIYHGSIAGRVSAAGSGTVNISGGSVGSYMRAIDHRRVG